MATNDSADTGGQGNNQLAQLMQLLSTQLGTIQTGQLEHAQRFAEMEARQAQEREATQAHIKALQETIASLQATPATTPRSPTPPALPAFTVTPPSPPGQTKKKMTLPDPPRFDGNRKKYRNWRLEMEGKLRSDGTLLGTSADRFTYIYSRLGDTPQSMAAAFYESGGPGSARNPTHFLQYLTTTYEDPNVAQHALNNLDSMAQGKTESFAAFYPRFEKQLADAGGATWHAVVQINYLRKALNDEMKDHLVPMLHLPKDYPGFLQELHNLGANIDARRTTQRRASGRAPSSPQARNAPSDQKSTTYQNPERTIAPAHDVMDWEPTKISKAVQRQNKELEGKRAKWADEKEIALRRKEKRCLRCGRSGCWLSECPLLPPRRPNPQAQARVRKSRPKLPKVEDLVDADDSSSDQAETDEEELKE
jgi:hypothetical protein